MNEIKHAWLMVCLMAVKGACCCFFFFLSFFDTVLEFAVLVFSQLSYDGLN